MLVLCTSLTVSGPVTNAYLLFSYVLYFLYFFFSALSFVIAEGSRTKTNANVTSVLTGQQLNWNRLHFGSTNKRFRYARALRCRVYTIYMFFLMFLSRRTLLPNTRILWRGRCSILPRLRFQTSSSLLPRRAVFSEREFSKSRFCTRIDVHTPLF
jgi:hypothetical protein